MQRPVLEHAVGHDHQPSSIAGVTIRSERPSPVPLSPGSVQKIRDQVASVSVKRDR